MDRAQLGAEALDFTRVAEACGFPAVELITEHRAIEPLRRRLHAKESLDLAVAKIAAVNLPRALPPRDGVHVKNRFRFALGHRPA